MKTLLVLFKPALEILLVVLPGLLLVALGIVWLARRRSHRGTPPRPNDLPPQ
jgi:hypothetical protein